MRSRAWLRWGLIAMSIYHVFVLPAVFVLGPALSERQLDGASSWAAIVACFGSAASWATCWRCASRCGARCSSPPWRWWVPARRPRSSAAASAPSASPALELLAGVCVALFFTLWDLSIQEQIPSHLVSRVSAYDFSVSMGLMPLGMAVCGPIADAIGLQETLLGMSAVGLAGALAWLAQPSVRRLRRPQPEPPPQDRPAARPTGQDPSRPVVGAGGR